jgi:hypothetical protein
LAIMDYHMDRMSFGRNEGTIDTVLILVVPMESNERTNLVLVRFGQLIGRKDGELRHPQFEPSSSRKWEGAISSSSGSGAAATHLTLLPPT